MMNNLEEIIAEVERWSPSSITEIESGYSLDPLAFKSAIKERVKLLSLDFHLEKGHCAIINHANSIQFFIDFLALYFMEVTAIPIDPGTAQRELDTIIAFSRASAVMNEANILKMNGVASAELEGIALVLFTSGTTSSPKGVKISRRSLENKFNTLSNAIGQNAVENSLCFIPTFFGHGLICNSLFPIFRGKNFFIAKKLTISIAQNFANFLEKYKISFFSSVPSHWDILLEFSDAPLSSFLRRVNCASAPLSVDKAQRILAWLGDTTAFYDVYGATEMLGWFADNHLKKENIAIGFKNFWDLEYHVNEKNELLLKSNYMFDGYWSQDQLPREEYFNTGDIFLDNKIIGRTKNTINKSGVKIQAEDIVYDFMQSGMLKDAGVFAIDDTFTGQQIGLFVVLKDKFKIDDIVKFCTSSISLSKHPAQIIEVKKMPRDARGKTSFKHLTQTFLDYKSTEDNVLNIFNTIFKTNFKNIDISRKNIMNWDSMRHAELIISLQRAFKIRFSAKDIGSVENLREIVVLVNERVFEGGDRLEQVYSILRSFFLFCCIFFYTVLFMQPCAKAEKSIHESIFNQKPHVTKGGYGEPAARIDNQITLKIPEGRAGEVYQYLRATYVESDEFVKKNFSGLDLKAQQRIDISDFTDEYFDTANLDFYKTQSSLRHRTRLNTTDATDKKNGRQLVQLKYTPPGNFEMRVELKFKVQKSYKGQDLIVSIKEEQRSDFLAAVSKMGFDPHNLRHILTNQQKRSRIYLDWNGGGFLSFSVDEFHSNFLWAKAAASSIDIGLQESDFTAASEAKRENMIKMRAVIMNNLKEHFPYLEKNLDEKYSILLSQLIQNFPFFRFLVKLQLT